MSRGRRTFARSVPGDRWARTPAPHQNGVPMNTRTIAIAALVIAVILLIIFLF
jgi:hypothetical protein